MLFLPLLITLLVPEGNHRVTVGLGDDTEAAETTVTAEVRRLYLGRVRTGPGDSLTRTFLVNVRLKDREKTTEAESWDDKLTIRWDGKVRSVRSEAGKWPQERTRSGPARSLPLSASR